MLIDLLSHEWLYGPLPADRAQLARILGVAKDEFEANWPGVAASFRETPAGLVNPKLEDDLAEAVQRKRAAVKRASAGGLAASAARRTGQAGGQAHLKRASSVLSTSHISTPHISHLDSTSTPERADSDSEVLRKARKALANGIDAATVERSFGLSVAEIQAAP